MRVSVNKNDPGYFIGAQRCEVYLDGEFVESCLTADEEKGEVVVLAPDNRMEKYTGRVFILVPAELQEFLTDQTGKEKGYNC